MDADGVLVYGDPAYQPSTGLLSARIALFAVCVTFAKQGQKNANAFILRFKAVLSNAILKTIKYTSKRLKRFYGHSNGLHGDFSVSVALAIAFPSVFSCFCK